MKNNPALQGFIELAQSAPDHAWRYLEKLYNKGPSYHAAISEAISIIPTSMMLPPTEDDPFRGSFWNKLIKNDELSLLESIFNQSTRLDSQDHLKSSLIEEIFTRRFGSVCATKDPDVLNLLFPTDKPINVDHKQWSMALLRKNMPLLSKLNFPVQSLRAISFIDNYFFDLQLTQLKYLSQYIPDQEWPIRFVTDALIRQKGPGVLNFFVDKALNNPKLSQAELGRCLHACIQTHQTRIFQRIIQAIDQSKIPFDFSKPFDLPDIKLTGGDQDFSISVNKLPAHLRQATLIEHAFIQGDETVFRFVESSLSSQLPSKENIDQWTQALEHIFERSNLTDEWKKCYWDDFNSKISPAPSNDKPKFKIR